MRALGVAGRLLSRFLILSAKALGGTSGAATFSTDNVAATYKRPDEYRP